MLSIFNSSCFCRISLIPNWRSVLWVLIIGLWEHMTCTYVHDMHIHWICHNTIFFFRLWIISSHYYLTFHLTMIVNEEYEIMVCVQILHSMSCFKIDHSEIVNFLITIFYRTISRSGGIMTAHYCN